MPTARLAAGLSSVGDMPVSQSEGLNGPAVLRELHKTVALTLVVVGYRYY
jgi:hypothetical protein